MSNWPRSACITANEKNPAPAWQQQDKGKAGSPGRSRQHQSCQEPALPGSLERVSGETSWTSADQHLFCRRDRSSRQQSDILVSFLNEQHSACWRKSRRDPGSDPCPEHGVQGLCSRPIRASVITAVPWLAANAAVKHHPADFLSHSSRGCCSEEAEVSALLRICSGHMLWGRDTEWRRRQWGGGAGWM